MSLTKKTNIFEKLRGKLAKHVLKKYQKDMFAFKAIISHYSDAFDSLVEMYLTLDGNHESKHDSGITFLSTIKEVAEYNDIKVSEVNYEMYYDYNDGIINPILEMLQDVNWKDAEAKQLFIDLLKDKSISNLIIAVNIALKAKFI